MEELEKNKLFNILKWIFIIISMIHVFYATFTLRGIYEDGCFYIIELLNHLAGGSMEMQIDWGHPRFFMLAFMQIPVIFAYKILLVSNKFTLMQLFTFTQFFLPLLILYWNYNLTKRTGRIDILFWSIFVYGGINLCFSIFSVVESLIGSMFHFVLWNYLASKTDYTKKDIIYITFLLILMFGTFEYVIILGIIFFLASFHYVSKETNLKNQLVKTYIGIMSLFAAIFNVIFMLKIPDEGSEISRFFNECHDFLSVIFNLNFLFTIAAIAILIILMFKKSLLTNKQVIAAVCIFVCLFIRLSNMPELSIYPMWEQHLRTITCWLLPVLFTCMWIADIIKEEKNTVKFINYICIILICATAQTCWQIQHDYYWNKNLEYLKTELNNTKDLLYKPIEHEELSSFHNPQLRRYIWHGTFPAMSILLSEDKEIKTLLLSYDKPTDEGNGTFREWLFVPKNDENVMYIPFGGSINIKNQFWDITKCAKALDKYNKENKIKTMEDMWQ